MLFKPKESISCSKKRFRGDAKLLVRKDTRCEAKTTSGTKLSGEKNPLG